MEYLNETSQICWSSKVTYCDKGSSLLPFQFMSYLPLIDLKKGFWPVVHLLYGISEWNFTDMLDIKGYIFLVRTVTLTFPVHELSALDWSEKWFLTCSSFTIWSIWMKLHRYVDHQRLHIVTKDVISLSISVLLLFRHYISHKITFGAPSSGGVLCSACGAFIQILYSKQKKWVCWSPLNAVNFAFFFVSCWYFVFQNQL